MPLQKPPPLGPPAIDSQAAKRRHLQERRRTLQTISELSVVDGITPNFTRSKGPRPRDIPDPPGVSTDGRKTSHMNKRRSLPQYCARPECNATLSTISMSPMHLTGVQRLRSESGVHGISPSLYEVGWNARREKARMQTEQALVGAQRRSNHSTSNIRVGNFPTSPTVSLLPRAKSSRPELRPYSSQQNLLRNSLSTTRISSHSKRQSDLDISTKLNLDFGIDLGSSRRTNSDSSSFHSTHESVVRRSRSGSSTTSYTSQEVPPIPTGRSLIAQRVRAIPTSSDDIAAVQIPISVHAKPGSIPRMYSSSLINLDHGISYGNADDNVYISSQTRPERKQQSSRRSSVSQHPTNASLDLQRSLGRHASYTVADQSQQGAVPQAPHEIIASTNPRPSQLSSSQRHSRSRSRLKATSPISTPPPAYSASSVSDLIYSQNPDKIGLSSPIDTNLDKRSIPNRESLIKWKSEREEARAEFDGIQRAKVKERVRRANEMEQEKEKELQELGKGTDKAARVLGKGLKTKKRGCFGGLFDRFKSKLLRGK